MVSQPGPQQSNFAFLQEHEAVLFQLAIGAERLFASDPNACLIKLRQLGEALAQDVALRSGIAFDAQTSQLELLHRLSREINLDREVSELFHVLRVEGKRVTPEFGLGERIPIINEFVEAELARHGAAFTGQRRPDLVSGGDIRDELNRIFRSALSM